MIYKDPFANRTVKEGKWFAWYPVQLQYENKTAWLSHINREWIEGAGGGMWIYTKLEDYR